MKPPGADPKTGLFAHCATGFSDCPLFDHRQRRTQKKSRHSTRQPHQRRNATLARDGARSCTPMSSYQWHDYAPRIFAHDEGADGVGSIHDEFSTLLLHPRESTRYGVFCQFSDLDLEGRVRLIWPFQRPLVFFFSLSCWRAHFGTVFFCVQTVCYALSRAPMPRVIQKKKKSHPGLSSSSTRVGPGRTPSVHPFPLRWGGRGWYMKHTVHDTISNT